MIRKPRWSLLAGPIAMVVLIASAAWVLWSSFERSKEAGRSVEHTYHVLIASERFLSTIREMESDVRAYVITRNRNFVPPYQAALATQAKILGDLDLLTKDNPQQQASLRTIRAITAQRITFLAQAERDVTAGRNPVASGGTSVLGQGPKLMIDLTNQVHEFEEEERRLLDLRNNYAGEAANWTRFMLVFTSGLLAIVLLFAGAAVERYVRSREAAHEALQRQADLIDFSHDAIVTLDPKGVITGWNAGAVEMYGWSSAEALGKRARDLVLTNDPAAPSKIEETLATTGRWDGELTQTTKDGRLCIVESRFVQVRSRSGVPVGILNISRDETQRRRAEELVRQVAEQRRLALDAAELGSWDYDVKKDSVVWDERCRVIMGLPGLGPASFEKALKMVHPDERGKMRQASNRAMSGGNEGRFSQEMRIQLRDGSVRWLATHGRVYFEDVEGVKRPVRVIGVNSDITERKRVDEALRESEDKVRVALETGRIGIFYEVVDEGKIVLDERAKEMLGFEPHEEMNPAEFFRRLHPDDQERIQSARSYDLENAQTDPGELDYRIIHPNGDVRWLVARRRVYFDAEKKRAHRVLGVLLDITEQKRAEQKLTEALRRVQAILETMPAGVVLADCDNKLVEANAEAVQIWRAGSFATLSQRIQELRGWRADSGEVLRLEDWPRTRALQGETVLGEIIDVERFDGSRGTVFNSASPVRDANGKVHGAVGVMVDITEQRRVEQSLRVAHRDLERLLEQKNILFQEVQHRVKNNLQIVSSLLSLEAQRFEDSAFHNALNESRDRIRSMALMHEKFYHLDDLARIDFADYVEELAGYFFNSYLLDASAIGFESNVDVKLKMGEAMPCGLVLQELLSNSVKHAFPDGKGKIRIDFHEMDGVHRLCYWDSGPGLPLSVNLKKPASLGLQLVTDLAYQLQGKIEYEYQQGSQFTLTFS